MSLVTGPSIQVTGTDWVSEPTPAMQEHGGRIFLLSRIGDPMHACQQTTPAHPVVAHTVTADCCQIGLSDTIWGPNTRKIFSVPHPTRNFGRTRPSDPKRSEQPGVRRIGSLMNQLISRRGYAQVTVDEELHRTVAAVIGDQLAADFQIGNLRKGVLQIYATDSVTLQELNFRKRAILKRLQKELPQNRVTDLRFRIQS